MKMAPILIATIAASDAHTTSGESLSRQECQCGKVPSPHGDALPYIKGLKWSS